MDNKTFEQRMKEKLAKRESFKDVIESLEENGPGQPGPEAKQAAKPLPPEPTEPVVDLSRSEKKPRSGKKNAESKPEPLSPPINKEEPRQNRQEYEFPEGFLWGTSTSAYQVEGGVETDWSRWEKNPRRQAKLVKQGKDPDDFVCGQAVDSYARYEEDLELAAKLNTNAIRFGIEWARIQPKPGVWDVEAVNHYHELMKSAKKKGFKIVLTLWHWTSPTWTIRDGGWAGKKIVEQYSEYVDFAVKEYGAYVDYWVTINEPMVYIANGFISGKFAPGKKNIFKAEKVFGNLADAHKQGYKIIHDHYPNAMVSITEIVNYIEPARKWCLWEVFLAKLGHYYWNHRFLKKINGYFDYIGLDYYFHDRIVWYPPFKKNKNEKTTDMGWEIYPEGIYHVLKYLDRFNVPVLILENGLADSADRHRADFIRDHLYQVHRAISEGVKVKGYFHWSLLDNFEWSSGYGPKFGLYEVKRDTMERAPRPSSAVYADIAKNNRVLR